MTEQANPTLEVIEDLFHDTVWKAGVEGALTAIFTQAPWLNAWPLRPITQALIRFGAEKLFQQIKLFIDLKAISLVNAQHKRDFEKASVTLRVIAIKHGVHSEEFKNARENAKALFAEFARYRG